MIKPETRYFIWNTQEENLQSSAEVDMSEIAEEHNIEITSCGGSNFNSVANNLGYNPSIFNVAQFNEWKENVSRRTWDALVKIEEEEMKELISKYRNTLNLDGKA